MLRRTSSVAIAAFLGLAGIARADDPLLTRLASRVGQTLDAKNDAALLAELANRGLIERGRATLAVDAALVKRVVGNERYRERLAVRYFAGDRVFVEESGDIHQRAEIAKVNADGTYTLKVWDKYSGSYDAAVWDDEHNAAARPIVDAVTGKLPAKRLAEWATDVQVVEKDGTTKTVKMFEPWLERPNERLVTVTHAELERLNGVASPGAHGEPYTLNGFLVDPSVDKVLAERIEGARQKLDALIASGKLDLTLPEDPAEAKKKLEEISSVLRHYYLEISEDNRMGYPDKPEFIDKARQRDADASMVVNGQTLAGAMLKWGVGVCFEQTAALGAIQREVGRPAGVDFLAVGGMISGGGHSYGRLRFPDGRSFLTDPSWLAQDATRGDEWLENIDFATFDARHWSARQIREISEGIDHPTTFADVSARTAVVNPHGGALEGLIAAEAARRMKDDPTLGAATATRMAVLQYATALPANTNRVALEARVAAAASALAGKPAATPGLISLLRDRVKDAIDDTAKDMKR